MVHSKKKEKKINHSTSLKKKRKKSFFSSKIKNSIKKQRRVFQDMILNLPTKLHINKKHNYMQPLTQKLLRIWFKSLEKPRFSTANILLVKPFYKTKLLAQKRLRALRHQKKSKLTLAFFQPWKNIVSRPTRKQHFLNTNYTRYKHLRIKDRFDFFRTHIGQTLLSTEMHSHKDYKNTWFSKNNIYWRTHHLEHYWKLLHKYDLEIKQKSLWQTHFFFSQIYKKSWWYENLIQKKKKPTSARHFTLDRPQTAFQIHWKQEKKEPWKNALLFKRAIYLGFGEFLRKENKFKILKMKPYLRRKNPRSEKRNLLYKRSGFLLTNFRQRSRIYAKKAARIKQIVRKIIWPFYGNLRIRQMNRIYKKSGQKKSKILARDEIILNRFENRLDVVVYRLNLAPTILWARRLIKEGCIFVTPEQSSILWESMYASLKKLAFPLKLRDPKNLYSLRLWTYEPEHWAVFKFLGHPQKKTSYLVKPGDLIQCAAENSLHQFKTKSSLWQKPLPGHLLTKKYPRFFWERRFEKFTPKFFNSWEQKTERFNAAVFLHSPRFRDLNPKDRITESFFRWTIL